MNFKVSSTALYSHMTAASKVMASKNSMAILDCFLFDVKDNTVTITASDSEKYFITQVPLFEQSENARFCIPAKTIMDSIKELAEQPLTIEFSPETLSIKGYHNSGTFGVMAQDAAPYPVPRTVKEECTSLTMPAETLLKGINNCLFATANDEVRLVMNGIYVDIKPESLTFAGTDGRKLVRNIMHNVKSGFEAGFILPKKVASILKAVLSKDAGNIEIKFDNDKACIKAQDIVMHFSLIEGRYPNYNGVIPADNPFKSVTDRQALASALKRVSVFCNQSSGLVKLELAQNTLKLTGQDYEFATNAIEYQNCEYSGQNIHIGFSCQFLIEILNILDSESVSIELADPSRPGIIKPVPASEDEEILMLLMPMRVEE